MQAPSHLATEFISVPTHYIGRLSKDSSRRNSGNLDLSSPGLLDRWWPSSSKISHSPLRSVCSTTRRKGTATHGSTAIISHYASSRPFLNTGPLTLKTWRGRGAKCHKGWLAIFVCFSTSAVHLEAVTDYSTDGFIAAYRRLTGRRGICQTLFSDCGTNFQGTDTSLKRLFNAGSKEFSELAQLLTHDGTTWVFNPPATPHFGGKWEAAVKSVKHHLRRTIGETALTYEEFTTLLVQIEAVLNSRPLCPLSDDPEDLAALTPGHFIIGAAPTTIPEPSLSVVPLPRLSRWQLIQQQFQHFWSRWSAEYLQRQLAISKWHHPSTQIKVGSLVLLTDKRFPPSKWPLARVTQLHLGSDGLCRVVTLKALKTATTELKRPITKLAVLLTTPDQPSPTDQPATDSASPSPIA
ncbi:uncharacterized protein [Polyergus mexicanus]|uniref:uncharacterized protein n=1 Tax=Polyergus mexicanus TaxID=615972 RepID=UPI0038B47066